MAKPSAVSRSSIAAYRFEFPAGITVVGPIARERSRMRPKTDGGIFAATAKGLTLIYAWPNMKLGCLDGKTPREALAEGVYKIRVLAAIMVLEDIAESVRCNFDFNELRTKLGLPVLGPIDPEKNWRSQYAAGAFDAAHAR